MLPFFPSIFSFFKYIDIYILIYNNDFFKIYLKKSETEHSGERSGYFNEALQTGKPFLLYISNRRSELKVK